MTPKTILVIDFDQKSLGTLKDTLSGEGYRVLTATDGQIGWDKFIDETPDLILIEPMLSKLHGFELCQKITSHPEYKVPVFIMTGVYKDFIYKSEALRTYGASEYFEKPLDMPAFLEAIRRAVPTLKPEPKEEVTPVPPPVRATPQTPPPAQAAPKKEHKYEVPSIEELKSLVSEPTPKKEPGKAAAASDPGKEGRDEIDAMLKSALSDFGLGEDKKNNGDKPKPAAPSAAPPPPIPAEKKFETAPKTAPSPARPATPEAPPPRRQEKGIVFGPPPMTPIESRYHEGPKADPQRRAPHSEDRKAEPAPMPVTPPRPPIPSKTDSRPLESRTERTRQEPASATVPADRPADRDRIAPAIFEDLHKSEKKKGVPLIAIVAASAVVLGAAGFLFLRPKPKPITPQIQSNLKPISAPVQTETEGTQTPEEFSSEVEKRAAALENEIAAKAQAAAVQPPPNEIVGEAVLSVPVKPGSKRLEIAGPEENRNGGDNSARNPAAKSTPSKPPARNPVIPPAKTETEPPAKAEAAAPPVEETSTATTDPPRPAAKTVNEGDLWPLDDVDVPPQVTKKVDPAYPTRAVRFELEGTITVNALISENGSVIDTGILKGMKDDMGLEKAAQNAVRKWKFEPARKNGVNVKVWRPIVITFALDK